MFKFKEKRSVYEKKTSCFVLTTFTNSVRIRNLNIKRGVHTFL